MARLISLLKRPGNYSIVKAGTISLGFVLFLEFSIAYLIPRE